MFCGNCGHKIEDGEAFCGNCGQAVSRTQKVQEVDIAKLIKKLPFKQIGYGVLVVLFVALLIWSFIDMSNPDNDLLDISSMREAYAASQQAVSDSLLAPTSAEFPKFDSKYVTRNFGEYTFYGRPCYVYTVNAYVDAQNTYGVLVRSYYSVDIIFPEGREKGEFYYENLQID